ncbi:MAG TPA: YsnF/AvaK domain-containing protein [Bryobacteraceae bacterium]|nr:YsnF/AvaK domain-containing protein [Bryobacteraceae bacterium]
MSSASNSSTFICAFRSINDAQSAIQDLVTAGINRESISLIAGDAEGRYANSLPDTHDVKKTSDGTTIGQNVAVGSGVGALGGLLLGFGALAIPGFGPVLAAGPLAAALGGAITGAAGGGVIGALKDAGVPDEDAKFYGETIRKGGALVSLEADNSQEHQIDRILSRYNAVEIGEGDYPMGGHTAATEAMPPAVPTATRSIEEGQRVIPVIEEELAIGKREIQTGQVRVYTRVVEKPFEQQISLRDEHVKVERRPVDRAISLGEADAALHQQSIEVTETDEEAVVSKQARVVEEVVVRKETTEKATTVKDTVRRTDVEVEQLGERPKGSK